MSAPTPKTRLGIPLVLVVVMLAGLVSAVAAGGRNHSTTDAGGTSADARGGGKGRGDERKNENGTKHGGDDENEELIVDVSPDPEQTTTTSEPTTSEPPSPITEGTTTTTVNQSTTTEPGSPGGDPTGQPVAPIRAAFLYPWFPNAWRQGGIDPFTNFTPSFGRYSSSDPALIRRQLDLAGTAHLDAFIASWWGQGHHTDQAMPSLLDTTVAADSPNRSLKWSIYYEPEGQGDPTVAELVDDLRYLSESYFSHPAYLRVDGRPVVFVWAEGSDGAEMAGRWAEAKAQFGGDVYVVLKVYSGYRTTPDQPDSWHQYGPAVAYDEQGSYSATVSPGFWLVGEGPRLGRDVARFERDVVRMNEAGTFWQLVTSWNEWGEGTAIEPAEEFGLAYIDALAAHPPVKQTVSGQPTTTTTSTPSTPTTAASTTAAPTTSAPTTSASPTTAPSSSTGSVRFAAGGDHGSNDRSDASFRGVAAVNPQFYLALGDLSYGGSSDEATWCRFVKDRLGDTPVQLLVGNHEDDDRHDGYIGNFVDCLPDRMQSTGTYGSEYYFDVDGLVRVIMIGADNDVAGVDYDYSAGTSHYRWLSNTIDAARADGIPWVVVGIHKVCITAGVKPCEIGTDVVDLMIDKKVDLVLHGHEHNYQRSKQVTCVEVNRYRPECVADDGADGRYRQGAGLVWAVAGNFGGSGMYQVDHSDPEFGYLAASVGGGDPGSGRGFLQIDADAQHLNVQFVGTTTSYHDSFSITR